MTLAIHLQRDLQDLRKEILLLGNMVESAINEAMVALNSRRPELAEKVLVEASAIDEKEVHIEELCLKTLALHQPVAVDLRFLVVVLKVNNDLERMGDFAENLSNRALFLNSHPALSLPVEFTEQLPKHIHFMVRNALDSLIKLDIALAHEVIVKDDKVDDINRLMYDKLENLMRRDPDMVTRAVHTLSCSRNLERIADLATNIAEDVIFMVKGEVIRHQHTVNL